MSVPSGFLAEYVDAAKIPSPIPRPPSTAEKTVEDVTKLLHAGKYKEAKRLVRAQHWPLDHPRRGDLWTSLSMYHVRPREIASDYWTLVGEVVGSVGWPSNLPSFTDPLYCEDYLLNEEGQRRVERILYLISSSYPFITYCPLLHPLASLFLHFVCEERTYDCLCALVEGTTVRHLSQTQLMCDVSAFSLMQLTKRLSSRTYGCMLAKVGTEEELEKLFRTWLLWIFRGLPFYHLVRVMDCFLLEGVRALYRAAMAILTMYIEDHANEFPKDSLLARFVPGRRRACTRMDPSALVESIVLYVRNLNTNVDRLFKTAYGIKGLSARLLNKYLTRSDGVLRSRNRPSRSPSAVGLSEQKNLPSVPFLHGPKQERYAKRRTLSLRVLPVANFKSDVLEPNHMVSLWSWLPPRISILQPQLIYSTNEHGCSLSNMFAQIETWEPTILAILTSEGERLGAYCSTAWRERTGTYFGTGETFLFTFSPEAHCFPWVGASSAADVPHMAKLFLLGNQNAIQVGAGNGCGLYVDDDLMHGRSERCDTFGNDPLAPSGEFVIQVLEVFGFC